MPALATRAANKPFRTLTAADLMSTHVLTIPQDTSLREAARLLTGLNVSGAPVVDGYGCCLGVLSSSDFVTWACEREGKKEVTSFIAPWGEVINLDEAANNEIRHYMTTQPITVTPNVLIGEMAQKMVDAHIHRLLVVEHGKPCGIVTSTDILAAVMRETRTACRGDEM